MLFDHLRFSKKKGDLYDDRSHAYGLKERFKAYRGNHRIRYTWEGVLLVRTCEYPFPRIKLILLITILQIYDLFRARFRGIVAHLFWGGRYG
jgi:hypothetical protein